MSCYMGVRVFLDKVPLLDHFKVYFAHESIFNSGIEHNALQFLHFIKDYKVSVVPTWHIIIT